MFNRDNYINSPIEIKAELLLLFQKEKVKTVFDIGACEAEDSIRYSILFPKSTVYAFEPRKDNIAIGEASIQKYKRNNIVLENIALSNENGTAEFFLSEGQPKNASIELEWDFGNKSSSLLPPTEEMKKHTSWLQFNTRIQVETMRLDTYAKNKKIDAIDFVHIDVQGAELLVLEGAGDFLKNVKVIWMEVEAVELYKGQPLKTDVEIFMKKNNFVNVLDTVNEVAGDQLYVNSNHFSNEDILKIKSTKNKMGIVAKIKSYFNS